MHVDLQGLGDATIGRTREKRAVEWSLCSAEWRLPTVECNMHAVIASVPVKWL